MCSNASLYSVSCVSTLKADARDDAFDTVMCLHAWQRLLEHVFVYGVLCGCRVAKALKTSVFTGFAVCARHCFWQFLARVWGGELREY